MKQIIPFFRVFSLFLCWIAQTCSAGAQTSETPRPTQPLRIEMLFEAASQNHPLLKAARIETDASQTDVEAAQRQRLPAVSAVVESNSGNAYAQASHTLRVQQTLWDAGLNASKVSEAENAVLISKLKIELQQKQLFLQICNAWQSMVTAHQRVQIALNTMERLDGLKKQMQRRVDALASAPIDLILANSRQLQTQAELDNAQRNLKVALRKLELLSGMQRLDHYVQTLETLPSLPLAAPFLLQLDKTDWADISTRWPAVQIARYEVVSAQNRLRSKEAERWPQVYLRVEKPIGNYGYNANTSTTVFAGVSYTPGAGFANLVEAKALGQRISKSDMGVEAAMKDIQDALLVDREEFIHSYAQIPALQQSVKDSDAVLGSFERQFQASRKTWVDLLNQVRELAQNEYALGDSQASLMGAQFRLQVYLNQDIYQAPAP